mmetsp:Transcript_9393/g.26730  ORF Transcript_9393/g.26730 Transcript_9393/m.26730 type:complete len:229 (+) Transcript_9393:2836-3522(+)
MLEDIRLLQQVPHPVLRPRLVVLGRVHVHLVPVPVQGSLPLLLQPPQPLLFLLGDQHLGRGQGRPRRVDRLRLVLRLERLRVIRWVVDVLASFLLQHIGFLLGQRVSRLALLVHLHGNAHHDDHALARSALGDLSNLFTRTRHGNGSILVSTESSRNALHDGPNLTNPCARFLHRSRPLAVDAPHATIGLDDRVRSVRIAVSDRFFWIWRQMNVFQRTHSHPHDILYS